MHMRLPQDVGVPQDYLFSVADVEYEGPEERPRVADCLLWLKSIQEGTAATNDLATVADTEKAATPSAARPPHKPLQQSSQPFILSPSSSGGSQTSASAVPLPSTHRGGLQAASGIQKLMQHCTGMLREKMSCHIEVSSSVSMSSSSSRSGSDSFPYETVGPVLESVLGGLTQVRLGKVLKV